MPELTYRYRLYPTEKQAFEIRRTCGCARFLYNKLLEDRTRKYRETREWKKIDHTPYEALPFLITIDPGVLNWVQNSLERAYRNFFYTMNTKTDRYRPESEAKAAADESYILMDTDLMSYPRFKKKKTSKESYTTYIENLEIRGNRVLLPAVGRVKIKMHRPLPPDAEQISCTVLKKSCGHYYLNVRLRLPDVEVKKDLETSLGVVFVQGKLAVRSDEVPVEFRHQDEEIEKRIRQARKAMLRRTPGSRGYEEARLRLARLYEHRVNQRREDLHKAARQITNAGDVLYMQKPDVMEQLGHIDDGKLRGELLDEAWWTFGDMIRYKAEGEGKRFWSVVRAFPAYSLCSACDHRGESSPEGVCPACGVQMDADLNAACNLRNLGLKYIREMKELT